MTLIDFLFPKLGSSKMWSDKYLKTPISEDASTSNMVGKHAQALLKSTSQHLYHIH